MKTKSKKLTRQYKNRLKSRSVEYLFILAAISTDIWLSAKRRTVLYTALSVAHLSSLSLSAYLFYAIVHNLTRAANASASGGNKLNLYVLLALLLASLVTSALTGGGARRTAIKMAAQVNMLCVRRGVRLFASLPHCDSPFANHFVARGGLTRLAITDLRFCGVAARLLLLAVPEIALGIGALSIMLYLEPFLTLALTTLSALLTLTQYPVSLKIADASRKTDQAMPEFKRNLFALIKNVNSDIGDARETETTSSNLDYDYQFAHYSVAQYYRRQLYVEYGSILAQISSAIALCVAILALLYLAGKGKLDLALLSLFIACARQALASITKVSRSLITISRVFPQISRYFRFVWSATRSWPLLASQMEVRYSSQSEVERNVAAKRSSNGAVPVKPGLTYCVFASSGLTRVAAAAALDGLGFSADDLSQYEPRVCFANQCHDEDSPPTITSKKHVKKPWELSLRAADVDGEASLSRSKDTDPTILTELLFSTYHAAEQASQRVDVFVVLNPDHHVILQTCDRTEAIKALEKLLKDQAKVAETMLGGTTEDFDEED